MIDEDELFEIEYLYQTSRNIQKLANFRTDKKYILRYSQELDRDYKTMVYLKNAKSSKVTDLALDTKDVEMYLSGLIKEKKHKNMLESNPDMEIE